VTLAPQSAIDIAYTPGERRIRLLAGEAFFEVTANPERPFRVAAGAVDVTVLGTDFDVRRGEDGADVSVAHGVVRVDHATADPPVAETLTAGQSVRVSWAGRAQRSGGPAERVAAWRRNQLIARDEPLGAVVDELRRYYAGKIIVTDEALAARPVTGVYNLADPVEALRGIARAQKAVVRRVTPWVLIVSAS
jgi:transmembrane sensor